MSSLYAALISVAVCMSAAGLEGVCAGKNVKAYFAKLRWPPYSAPLWVWYTIGGVYYVTFFYILYRIIKLHGSELKLATLALILIMMILNAAWNYLFFRAQNLFLAFVGGCLAPIFDITLFVCLLYLDKIAAWALVPYLLYRIYALWWGYGLWKVNRPARTGPKTTIAF